MSGLFGPIASFYGGEVTVLLKGLCLSQMTFQALFHGAIIYFIIDKRSQTRYISETKIAISLRK